MLSKELEEKMNSKHKHMHEKSITASNMLKRKDELEQQLVKYEGYRLIIEREKEYYKQARAFLVNFQDEKYTKDSETIRRSMRLASSLVKQKNVIEPRFHRRTGLRPESIIVTTRNKREVNMALTEGTGVAESISSLTVLSVLQSTPYMKTVLWDEMYSSVSEENSIAISKMLNPMSDGLYQVLMIEQKDSVFEHTDYRDFRITYDGNVSVVNTYEVTDGVRVLIEGDKASG